jgi:glycosyltransferase involved in cell wall biosynthesis
MKVTVIITTYNRLHLLRKTYLSLLNQSIHPDELVISDDGSSEDLVSGLEDLIKKSDFNVKFVQQKDAGFRLARCRNNGARQASGDFLVFFDQDLLFSFRYLETLLNHAKPRQFVVGNPIRLTQPQSDLITDEMITLGDFNSVLTAMQRNMTKKQHRKELVYSVLYRLKLRRIGPKLRGGIVGFNKSDFIKVNGYDEKFEGWGNEDDDLGVRLYASGVRGANPFIEEYSLHLYHQRFHQGERANKTYQKKRMREINRKNFRCTYGYETHGSREDVVTKVLKQPSV